MARKTFQLTKLVMHHEKWKFCQTLMACLKSS